jgi:hypothetical protein
MPGSVRSAPPIAGGAEPGEHVLAVAVAGDAEGDVPWLAEVVQLVGEHAGEPGSPGDAGEGRDVVREGDRGEGPLAHHDGVDEFDGDVLCVRARAAVAEHQQPAALVEAPGDAVTGARDVFGIVGEELTWYFTALE